MKRKIMLLYTNVRLRNQKPRPPLGLMYIAAALRPKYEPIILDMRVEDNYKKILLDNLEECILVGISTIIGEQLVFSLEVANLVKRIDPKMPIVFGGTFPSMAPEIVLKEESVDIVSIGDGEETILKIADALNQNRDFIDIDNVAYKNNGEIIINKSHNTRCLDTPKIPAWDLVDINNYREANVLSTKGCSGGCTFCYNRIFNEGRLRVRKIENVWDEIQMLSRKYQVKHIAFVDDNFFANISHAIALMVKFRDSNLNLTWETTCRADDLANFSEEVLQLIHDSGCRELYVGFESASDKVLEQINKNIGVNQINECMTRARKYKFCVRALFMIGSMGETKRELFQTLKTVDVLQKKYYDCIKIPVFGIYTPYPKMPPDIEGYKEPKSMLEWSEYHHDRANQQWLSSKEKAYLENVIWVYRYYSKRSKFVSENSIVQRLLYIDASIRWKIRLFSLAPEWKHVRTNEQYKYKKAITELRKEYDKIVIELNNKQNKVSAK